MARTTTGRVHIGLVGSSNEIMASSEGSTMHVVENVIDCGLTQQLVDDLREMSF
jgi:hypothetical protein